MDLGQYRNAPDDCVQRNLSVYPKKKPAVAVVLFLFLSNTRFQLLAKPVTSHDIKAMEYLQKYGYMKESSAYTLRMMDKETFSSAIKEFQKFAELEETGELDDKTLTIMNSPRCGMIDKVERKESKMSRYSLGSRWSRRDLTYKIGKYSRAIRDKKVVEEEIERAFKVWSNVTFLRFSTFNLGPVDIELRFQVRSHGDWNPFDGPGGTLAHASGPDGGGDACFDDEERWTVKQYNGTNLFQVAAHEIGHSLGLGHSYVKNSLMYPIYQGYQPNFRLHGDDIQGIQKLYGRPTKPKTAPLDPEIGDDVPDLCQDSGLDAATITRDRKIYVFKGDYYWRIGKNGVSEGYPRRIASDWKGLSGSVDAALTLRNGRTYFFKGNQYYKFRKQNLEPGYPKNISDGIKGIPDGIDATFHWGGDNKTYFIKGDKYWRYDRERDPPVGSDYPKPLKDWGGLSGTVDAVLPWPDGKLFFFQQQEFNKLKAKSYVIDKASPPYPRMTSLWWFKCEKTR